MSDTLPDSLVARLDAAQDDSPPCLFCGSATELDFDPATLAGPLFFVSCTCGARGPTATTPEDAITEYSPMIPTTTTP